MNRENLLTLYERFTGLVEKLPGGLQKPILRELIPIRELFLEQRAARIMLVGGTGQSVAQFVNTLCSAPLEPGENDNGWRTYGSDVHDNLQILDARFDVPQGAIDAALHRFPPDIVVCLTEEISDDSVMQSALARVAACPVETAMVGLADGPEPKHARLSALLNSRKEFSQRRLLVVPWERLQAAEALCTRLPRAAQLEFARLTGAKTAQAQIAASLLKSFTAVCGVIGLQPIPLADLPILTSLQSLMVGLIIYTTGKPIRPKLVAEFLGAMGLNIGAAVLFREGARAIVKIVPFWGNAVSGLIAGGGTYAIGRAAISYFIEESPIHETRQLFNKLLPAWNSFSRGKRSPRIKNIPPPLPPPKD